MREFAVPHPDITYLVASRCHPDVFKRLEGCKIIVWHAGGDHNINDLLCERKLNEPMVNGGSAGVTRAMFLVNCLGYTDQHIFGADSSYTGDDTHIRGSLVPEKDLMVSIVAPDGRPARMVLAEDRTPAVGPSLDPNLSPGQPPGPVAPAWSALTQAGQDCPPDSIPCPPAGR